MLHNAVALCYSATRLLSLYKQACKMTDAMLHFCVSTQIISIQNY